MINITPYIYSKDLKLNLQIQDKYRDPMVYILNNATILNKLIFVDELIVKYHKFYKYFSDINFGNFLLNKKSNNYLYGTYLFANHPFCNNYSHFTLQVVSSILYVKEKNILNNKIKIITNNEKRFQKDLLQLLEIDNDIIFLNDYTPYTVETLIFCDMHYDPNFCQYVDDCFKNIGKKFYKDSSIEKIYVTRKDSKIRPCVNEDDVIDFLKTIGYSIVTMCDYSVQQQISLFVNAKYIVAAHGASGSNLFYCFNSFNFLEFFSECRFSNFHTRILINKECVYSATVNPIKNKKNIDHKDEPYICNIDLLKKALSRPNYIFERNFSYSNNLSKVFDIFFKDDGLIPPINKMFLSYQKIVNNNSSIEKRKIFIENCIKEFPSNVFFLQEFKKLKYISQLNSNMIITHHLTSFIIFDKKLMHRDVRKSNIFYYLYHDKIAICELTSGFFIKKIDQYGNIEFSHEIQYFMIKRNIFGKYIIMQDSDCLSARDKGGVVSLMPEARDWEYYDII